MQENKTGLTDVERLVERMVEVYAERLKDEVNTVFCKDMECVLRIVLKAIQDGEVVSCTCSVNGKMDNLKPSFKEFLEAKCSK